LGDRPSAVAWRLLPTGEANGRTLFMYYVYVLKSKKDNNLYIGCTGNLAERLEYHNSGKVKSTKPRRPFEVIFYEEYDDKYEAFNMEKYYKTIKGKRELKLKIK
jgi:putative endonuclease